VPAEAQKPERWVIHLDQRKIRALVLGGLVSLLVGLLLGLAALALDKAPDFHSRPRVVIGRRSLTGAGLGAVLVCTGLFCVCYYGRSLGDTRPKLILDEHGLTEYLSSPAGKVIAWSEIGTIADLPTATTSSRPMRNRLLRRSRRVPEIIIGLKRTSGPEKQVILKVSCLERDAWTILQTMRRLGHIPRPTERPEVRIGEELRR
jgi:hypothetical protein